MNIFDTWKPHNIMCYAILSDEVIQTCPKEDALQSDENNQ